MSDITPKVDIAFKKIFGVEENKDLLISLINSIVSKEDQIAEVAILNPYNAQEFTRDKLSILDIKARGKGGKHYNIEMQITDEADYDKRALYYWAKLYTQQLEAGQDYSHLSKTIGIHILNFYSITSNDKYHNKFRITEEETGEPYFGDMEMHTIELKKFTKNISHELSDIAKKVKTSLDMWVAFLTRHNLLKTDKLTGALDDKNLKKAIGVLEVMSFTKAEREAYEDHLKWLMIEANTLKKAEEKGIKKGMQQRNVEIAKNLLSQGLELATISAATGLSIAELKKIQNTRS